MREEEQAKGRAGRRVARGVIREERRSCVASPASPCRPRFLIPPPLQTKCEGDLLGSRCVDERRGCDLTDWTWESLIKASQPANVPLIDNYLTGVGESPAGVEGGGWVCKGKGRGVERAPTPHYRVHAYCQPTPPWHASFCPPQRSSSPPRPSALANPGLPPPLPPLRPAPPLLAVHLRETANSIGIDFHRSTIQVASDGPATVENVGPEWGAVGGALNSTGPFEFLDPGMTCKQSWEQKGAEWVQNAKDFVLNGLLAGYNSQSSKVRVRREYRPQHAHPQPPLP